MEATVRLNHQPSAGDNEGVGSTLKAKHAERLADSYGRAKQHVTITIGRRCRIRERPTRISGAYRKEMHWWYLRANATQNDKRQKKPKQLHHHTVGIVLIGRRTTILPQVGRCLLDEVAGLMEAYSVSFCVTHSLPNRKVVSLASVGVLCRTLQAVDAFLFEFRYYNNCQYEKI